MFSVVIPLYNKASHILKCVNSILAQTYTQFELIIVNDGSMDNSLQALEHLKDKRIKVISQPNSGVSAARNKGVREAKYEYIAFVDADDWWDIHFLEDMKGLIERNPEAGLYGCNFFIVKHGINRPSTVGVDADFKEGYINYCEVYSNTFCVPINCSFVIVPKKAFDEENGFKNHLRFGEDFDLWIRIALKHKVAYLNKALAFSNQDVEVHTRALGGHKLWPKEAYFIFNLGYLQPYESQNEQLKKLIDGLRVRALLRYYLNKTYIKEIKEQLSKVDFDRQPLYYKLVYNIPLPLVKLYLNFRKIGSVVKQALLRKTIQG